jgi:hypothetical protein
MNNYTFVKNVGKQSKEIKTIPASNLEEAWEILQRVFGDVNGWLYSK